METANQTQLSLTEHFIQLETRHSATGRVPRRPRASGLVLKAGSAIEHNERVYVARHFKLNAGVAEALALSGPTHPLQLARTQLSRGRLDEAAASLHSISPGADETESVELLLEQARILAYEGDWAPCLERCNAGLAGEPAAITRMTLFQVRSVALFELGALDKSLRDIDTLESFKTLFPHAHTGFHGEILRARIQARMGAPRAARDRLHRLWLDELAREEPAAERLLSYVRALIDLARLERGPVADLALLCFRIGKAMNNALFQNLALLELHLSERGMEGGEERLRERARMHDHKRIERLLDETHGSARTTSGKTLALPKAARSSRRPVGERELERDVESVLCLNPNFRVRFAPLAIEPVCVSPQSSQTLALFGAHAPLTKAELFGRLWPGRRYSPALHDDVLRNLLSRIKKHTGSSFPIRDGRIEPQDPICVLDEPREARA